MIHNSPPLELFLFDFCPYAQRALMNLIHSQLQFDTTVLKPGKMPSNFSSISPLGNVPVLRVNKTQSIFESAVINDYIAQISAINMEPESQIERAQMKAWSEYANTCLKAFMIMLKSSDEASFKSANEAFLKKFHPLAKQMNTQGPFYYGSLYTTIDSTYASLFLRMKTLSQLFPMFSYSGLPDNIEKWMSNILKTETLEKSILGDFQTIYRTFIANAAGESFVNKQI